MVPSSVRLRMRRSLSIVDLEGGPEHRATEPLQLRAVGLDVTQPGGVAVACHHRPQQLRGPGPAADPGVLAG